jgi:hypothetical protein
MREKLETMLKEHNWTITEFVINEALKEEEPKYFFEFLQQHGCISWCIGSLIRYKDTHAFYDRFYDEIEDIRLDLQDAWVLEKLPDWDLKNFFAWLSFEEVAYRIYNEIEGE